MIDSKNDFNIFINNDKFEDLIIKSINSTITILDNYTYN